MSTILQSLQSKWKYQGLGRIIFLATRRVLRPLVFWDIHYVFNRALSSHASAPPSHSESTISILKSELDLASAPADLTALCPLAAERLRCGQAIVVAFANPVTSDKATGKNLTGTTANMMTANTMTANAIAPEKTEIAGYT